MKQLVTVLALLLMLSFNNVSAEVFEVDGIRYETVDNNLNVGVAPAETGKSYTGAISIPGTVKHGGREYSVVAINKSAFEGATGVTSVKFDQTIASIKDAAFKGCTGITSIEIPNRTSILGVSAFEGCTNLGTVTLSNYLTKIESRAFADCVNLSRITVKDRINTIEDEAFYNCSKLSTIELPASLKSIGNGTFAKCKVLNNVKLGDNLIALGASAFMSCESLTSIDIPSTIKEIKESTFDGCSTLVTVKYPDGLSLIATKAFKGTAFSRMTIPATVKEIGDMAFNGCKSMVSLEFEDFATPIKYGAEVFTDSPIETLKLGRTLNCAEGASGAFENFLRLKNVEITSTCTSLPTSIFSGCTALVNVTVEPGLLEVGKSAFEYCENIITLELPETVQNIRSSAFASCYKLTNFNIPPRLKEIELRAFYECRELKTPDLTNITEIQNQGFYGCDNIDGITFSPALITIGNDAFSDCHSLSSISIPGTVTTLGNGVFFNCPKLVSVTFEAGDKLLRMGDEEFIDCPIREFTLGRDIEFTGKSENNIFGANKTLYEVSILPSVTRISDNMFDGCLKLSEVTIPASVNRIGDNAFGDCPDLKTITSKNDTAPAATSGSFSSTVYNNAKLIVSEDAEESYKSATGWKNFKQFGTLPGVPKYNVTSSVSGPGVVLLNGIASGQIVVKEGDPLTIVATPEEGKILQSASYTMGGESKRFTSSATIQAVTSDVTVNVEFGDVPAVEPVSIAIEPSTVNIKPGETTQLYAVVEPYEATGNIVWSVTDGDEVVSVNGDGEVTGIKNGIAEITAKTVNGLTATAIVIVNDGSTRIEEIPWLQCGQKWQARLISDNEVVTSGVTWSSSNPSALSISESGMMEVVAYGFNYYDVTVEATYEGNRYVYELTLYPSQYYSFDGQDGLGFTAHPDYEGVFMWYYGDHFNPGSDSYTFPETAVDGFGYEYPVVGIESIWLADNVVNITLPKTLKHIALINAPDVEKVTSYAETVPSVSNLLGFYDPVIYVPADMVEAYKADSEWGDYRIMAIGDKPSYTFYFVPQKEAPVKSIPNCYVWSKKTGKEYCGNWPGAPMTATVVEGEKGWTYTLDLDDFIEEPMVIFNDMSDGTQSGDMELVNGGIYNWADLIGVSSVETIIADGVQITIDGLNVYAQGEITVYTMSGAKIASGVDKVTVPAAGLYIVVTSQGAAKIAVK